MVCPAAAPAWLAEGQGEGMSAREKQTSWAEDLRDAMLENHETWADVTKCTLTAEELNVKFYHGYGGTEGKPFTVWTMRHVYFPVQYDGAEWVDWVSRHPDGKPTRHVGGG